MLDLTVGEQPASAAPPPAGAGRGRLRGLPLLAMAPFWLFFGLFFVLPTGALLWLAVRSPAVPGKAAVPASGGGLLGQAPTPAQPAVPAKPAGFTGHYVRLALQGAFGRGLVNSIELSVFTALVSAVAGLLLAWAVVQGRGWFKQLVLSASAVFANFGGVPLAFLFVSTLGTAGILTKWFDHLGVDLTSSFDLYSLRGVELVYLYFLVPLMVLVVAPALEALRPQWREAASNLGASTWQYWRHVAAPVLLPTFVGSVALLFCSSFAAYATAAALTNGTLALTPLQIKAELSGNVLSGVETQHIAAALALVMVLIVVPLTVTYQLMERRTARWLQS
ncbi:MAG: ABC transporter permease [Jatrophihabitans sp.]|uniref:ABC transporter permease n=1 Tax=Jatrophihabitans sp. TaxID=1932789 RepID=UPI003F81298F